jgi:hypothetical protein
MLSGPEHRDSQLLVEEVGDHDQRGIESIGLESLVEGTEGGGTGLFGHGEGPVPVDVDDGGDIGPRCRRRYGGQVPFGDGPAADEGQP